MKKCLFILFSIFLVLFIQNKIFCEDFSIKQENSILTENDKNEFYNTAIEQVEYKPTFIKMIFIFIALIVLIFLTFWIFKKFMKIKIHQGNLTKNIKIIERRAISPKSVLILVEFEGKKILISESSLEVRKIKEIN